MTESPPGASASGSGAGVASPVACLRELLSRLRLLLDEERECLQRNDLSLLGEHIRRKDMLLLDISRFISRLPNEPDLRDQLAPDLEQLQAALTENREVLSRHLTAARDFSAFVEGCLRRHASDGTYSRRQRQREESRRRDECSR